MSKTATARTRAKTSSRLLALAGIVGTLALAGCGPTHVGYRGYGGSSSATYYAYEAPRTPVYVYPRYRAYSGNVHGYYYDDYGRRRYY